VLQSIMWMWFRLTERVNSAYRPIQIRDNRIPQRLPSVRKETWPEIRDSLNISEISKTTACAKCCAPSMELITISILTNRRIWYDLLGRLFRFWKISTANLRIVWRQLSTNCEMFSASQSP